MQPRTDSSQFFGTPFAPPTRLVTGDRPIPAIEAAKSSRRAAGWAIALAVLLGHAVPAHANVSKSASSARARSRAAGQHHLHRPDPAQSLGDRIVAFALSQQGQQVGDGECFALADTALSQAGAKSAAAFTAIDADTDYVWGTPVPLAKIRPGDILQFRNFRIRRLITRTIRNDFGTVAASTQNEELEDRDHHTAVVERINGPTISILEQNVAPLGRVVQRRDIELAPAVLTQTDPSDPAQQVTTQISVEGDVQAYRPQTAPVVLARRGPAPAGIGAVKASTTSVRRDS